MLTVSAIMAGGKKTRLECGFRHIHPSADGNRYIVRLGAGSAYLGTYDHLLDAKKALAKHLKCPLKDLPRSRRGKCDKKKEQRKRAKPSCKGVYTVAGGFEARSGGTYIGRFSTEALAAEALEQFLGQRPAKRCRAQRETVSVAVERFRTMMELFEDGL